MQHAEIKAQVSMLTGEHGTVGHKEGCTLDQTRFLTLALHILLEHK